MTDRNRNTLAKEQAQLVRALMQTESDTPCTAKEFDTSRLRLTAGVLARKRARSTRPGRSVNPFHAFQSCWAVLRRACKNGLP